jgi:hypothetical protein
VGQVRYHSRMYDRTIQRVALHRLALSILLASLHVQVSAGPLIPAGDLTLRHDIQRLADHGVIKGTTSSWPLAWGPILADVQGADITALSPELAGALLRVRQRAEWDTRTGEVVFEGSVAFASNPTRIRSFQRTPRGEIEVSGGADFTAGFFAADLNAQYVRADNDSQEARIDDSYLGIVLGNWALGLSTQQRWWGPAWDGSLILSNNARPFPAVTLDRVFTDAFSPRWLSWIGPWDFSVLFGLLEEDREIPNAQFFGMRFNFRPIPSLEIGLSRTALWCGDGRPCGLGTFADLLLGRDNAGESGIDDSNEPGNQLAGFDLRYTPPWFDRSLAFYGQVIGEDEAGGLPSQYMGQGGVEWSGALGKRWSTRFFAEYSKTTCDVFGASDFSGGDGFNCAYAHGTYRTGYRYRRRSIGHGADNDAELITFGTILAAKDHLRWQAQVRAGRLNEGGDPDPRHTLTPTPQDVVSFDVSHSRTFRYGSAEIGAGYEWIDDKATSESSGDLRLFLQWRSAF